ncbi:methyl-CpG-binding domain-containing protein 2-like protein isoform X2 [Tanacetum coccineum]
MQSGQPRSTKITIKMGGKKPEITPTVNNQEGTIQNDQKPLEGPSVPSNGDIKETDQNAVANAVAVSLSEDETDDEDIDDETSPIDDSHKQMVIYDPPSNGSVVIRGVQNPDPERPRSSSRRPPEVAAFTVQCANCFKWRLIPDLPKYEVIREHITDQPFLCETTRQWGREITCDDPTDIKQDGTQIWAIDKPNIAKPPPGWQRLLRLRKEGSSKFADIYYTSPTGAKLRSLPEVQKFLENYPEHAQGIGLGRFSFQIPKPLVDNYVRKRPSQTTVPVPPESLEPKPVEPIAWARPAENLDLEIAEPLSWAGPVENKNGVPAYVTTPEVDPVNQAAKKAKISDDNCL